MDSRTIFITDADRTKLMSLLEARKRVSRLDEYYLWTLENELERAEIVNSEDVSSDVVTMYSHVRIKDLNTGSDMYYTLVFPGEADITQNRISVLAPIGTAILGYREGDVIEWRVPGGSRTLRIMRVMHQPEACPSLSQRHDRNRQSGATRSVLQS